ncbi:CPBP family glutamic-type intramembrane protease [Aquimarina sp. 2201CG5-10]|uniref:CPBP family glutamic-type intramembrane protease n=1 Tax=Aquimarina callyspongiae TaxID=3098150 RepID=UPI002AB3A7F3|nr:CPBP family glutamic-type intramembrane protease [Aquimarina sp. 2201CG5-10]MDY8135969.1 CPBP family glutamic-type intramembrane protease [Aquimarina sp. 2201CG5-10]
MSLSLINPKYYFNEFKKFIKYSIYPKPIETTTESALKKIKGTWVIFIIKTVLTIIVGIIVTSIYDPANKTSLRWQQEYSNYYIFFLSIILLPLLEEIAFRLSLKFKPLYLSLTIGVLSYYFLTKVVYKTSFSNTEVYIIHRALISIIIMLCSYFIVVQNKIKDKLQGFWKANFRWIFYFLCITFAWMHILNYGITLKHVLLLPLITLPKLISALSYGYIRMHFGFAYSLGLHMCWNSLGFIMSLFPAINNDIIF